MNTFKDLVGINKQISHRTSVQFIWSWVNPMFNVMEVEPGQEKLTNEDERGWDDDKMLARYLGRLLTGMMATTCKSNLQGRGNL